MNLGIAKEVMSSHLEEMERELLVLQYATWEVCKPVLEYVSNGVIGIAAGVEGLTSKLPRVHAFPKMMTLLLEASFILAACAPRGSSETPIVTAELPGATSEIGNPTELPEGMPTQAMQESEIKADARFVFFEDSKILEQKGLFETSRATAYDEQKTLWHYENGVDSELTVLGGFRVEIEGNDSGRTILFGTQPGGGERFVVKDDADTEWHVLTTLTYPGYPQFKDYGMFADQEGNAPVGIESGKQIVGLPIFGTESDSSGQVVKFLYFDRSGNAHEVQKDAFHGKMAMPAFVSPIYMETVAMMSTSPHKDTWNFRWNDQGVLQVVDGDQILYDHWDEAGGKWIEPIAEATKVDRPLRIDDRIDPVEQVSTIGGAVVNGAFMTDQSVAGKAPFVNMPDSLGAELILRAAATASLTHGPKGLDKVDDAQINEFGRTLAKVQSGEPGSSCSEVQATIFAWDEQNPSSEQQPITVEFFCGAGQLSPGARLINKIEIVYAKAFGEMTSDTYVTSPDWGRFTMTNRAGSGYETVVDGDTLRFVVGVNYQYGNNSRWSLAAATSQLFRWIEKNNGGSVKLSTQNSDDDAGLVYISKGFAVTK